MRLLIAGFFFIVSIALSIGASYVAHYASKPAQRRFWLTGILGFAAFVLTVMSVLTVSGP
jgi:succinate dehydrogenase hydrophobic anchor subunit